MKKMLTYIYDQKIWLFSIFILTIFFMFLAWLSYPKTFSVLVIMMVIVSISIAGLLITYSFQKEKELEKRFRLFLNDPSKENEAFLLMIFPKMKSPLVKKMAQILREDQDIHNKQKMQLAEYESYIEEWVHEIKKPLSLQTLVLDNRADEMSPTVQRRFTHARNEIQSDIEKILYFSRLNAAHKDYHFEYLDLMELCKEAIEENKSILEESQFTIHYSGESLFAISDRKSLLFILSQLIHNSTNYVVNEKPKLSFNLQKDKEVILTICDNGHGIPAENLPFIFDKGFTGGKEKATGIGLHLVKKVADDLAIELRTESQLLSGFCIELVFPKIKETNHTN